MADNALTAMPTVEGKFAAWSNVRVLDLSSNAIDELPADMMKEMAGTLGCELLCSMSMRRYAHVTGTTSAACVDAVRIVNQCANVTLPRALLSAVGDRSL